MAIAELAVNIVANTGNFVKNINKVSRQVDRTGKQMQAAGKSIMTLTAPLVAFGAVSVNAFRNFESAFAGVRKTVDASEAGFQKLSKGLMDMSERMPQSASDLAKIAENAGQLGVKEKDILKFTETMAKLGDATNLTSEEAAISLAQFANIVQLPLDEIDKLGASIVALGNNSATMESNIVRLAQRMASAGSRFGLTAAEIMGLSAALASTGVEAEAGGTAMSKVLKSMESAAISGGDKFDKFSKLIGVNLKESMEQSASGTFVRFIQALQDITESGGDVNKTLSQLGFSEVRTSDALGRLSANANAVRDAFALSSTEYEKNNALNEEAARRYETLDSRLSMLKNTLTNAAIVIGAELIPAINFLIEKVQDFVPVAKEWLNYFKDLSPETKSLIINVSLLGTAFGGFLFIAGKMISAIASLVSLKVVLVPLVTGLKVAFVALIPVVATLAKAGFALMLNPIGLAITAIAALAAGIYYFRDEIKEALTWITKFSKELVTGLKSAGGSAITTVKKMMDGIWRSITSGFNNVLNFVQSSTDKVTGFFNDMYIAVVGNSIVPDMVDGVVIEFDRLGSNMVGGAQTATRGVVSEFNQMSTFINRAFENVLGDSSNFITELAKTFNPQGIGGIFTDFFGDLMPQDTFNLQSIVGAYNGARPAGVSGPMMESGAFSSGGIVAGFSAAMPALVTMWSAVVAGGVIDGISSLVKGERFTGSDFEESTGGGAQGKGARAQLAWSTVGFSELYFAFEKALFKGTTNVGTLARRQFERMFNHVIDGKNIKIIDENGVLREIDKISVGAKDRFNKPWADSFHQLTGDASNAFLGVGYALQNLMGITEDIGGQIASILADEVGGSLQNLALIIMGMEIPIEDVEATMIEAFTNGSITAQEFSAHMQGINQVYAEIESAQNDLGLAIKLWLGSGGQGQEAVKGFQSVITAAMGQGIKTIEGFIEHAIASGMLTAAQGDQLMRAFAAHGISSMDQLANASDATFIHIIGSLQSMEIEGENSFFGLSEKLKDNFNTIEKNWEKIRKLPPAELEMKIKVTGDKAPVTVVPDQAKSTTMKIPALDTGGIVTSPTLALIGERRNEAVIPLQELPSMMKDMINFDSIVSAGKNAMGQVFNIDARGATRGVGEEIKRALIDFTDRKNGLLGAT